MSRFLLALSLTLMGCPSTPASTDVPVDAGTPDAPMPVDTGRDVGGADAGAACLAGSTCDIESGRGCSGGDVCAYLFSGGARANECVAPGAGMLGAACDANTDCAGGLSCILGFCTELCCEGVGTCTGTTTCTELDLTAAGTADAFGFCLCDVATNNCPANHYCEAFESSGTLGRCLAQGSCSRLMQDCGEGMGCYGTIRECATAGTAAVGATCMAHADCVPGAWCRFDAAGNTCSSYCDASGTDTCPSGFRCMSFGDDEPNVGGCYPM